MLLLLLLSGLLFTQASMSQISGIGNTTAEYGGKAHYRCTVGNPTGVLQVTWQRLFKDSSIENLATYSKRFGEQVNKPYRDKVSFAEASLISTSITVSNVTWADESCYVCSFNVYPDGSKRKQVCLTVQGISEASMERIDASGGSGDDWVEVGFSCSATGKPAPSIQWDFSPGATRSDHPATTTVTNGDQTFSSSSQITLLVPARWKGHVDCVLRAGVSTQQRHTIPVSLAGGDTQQEGRRRLSLSGLLLIITAAVSVSSIAAAAAVYTKRKKSQGTRRDENI